MSSAGADAARADFDNGVWSAAYQRFSAANRDHPLGPDDVERLAVAAQLVGEEAPEVWFQDEKLGGAFGANGVRLGPSRDRLYVVESVDDQGLGHVYWLKLGDPSRTLEELHRYTAGEVPDNIAFGGSGKLYVTLAGANQVQVLGPDGGEEHRFSGPARGPFGDVPYDMPSGVALHSASGSLLVNNHSEVLGIPERFVVFDVFVDDRAEPLIKPLLPLN